MKWILKMRILPTIYFMILGQTAKKKEKKHSTVLTLFECTELKIVFCLVGQSASIDLPHIPSGRTWGKCSMHQYWHESRKLLFYHFSFLMLPVWIKYAISNQVKISPIYVKTGGQLPSPRWWCGIGPFLKKKIWLV